MPLPYNPLTPSSYVITKVIKGESLWISIDNNRGEWQAKGRGTMYEGN